MRTGRATSLFHLIEELKLEVPSLNLYVKPEREKTFAALVRRINTRIAKRVAAMYCGKKRIMFEKWKTNISYTDYPAITRLF